MARVKANRIAVYVYRLTQSGPDFLQLHRSASSGDYAGSWQTVYGGIKKGETAIAAAQRELIEETGLAPRFMHQVEYLEGFYHQTKDRVTLLPVFAVMADLNAKVKLNSEHDAHRWVPLHQVGELFVWRVQRQAIEIIARDILGGSPGKDLLQSVPPRGASGHAK